MFTSQLCVNFWWLCCLFEPMSWQNWFCGLGCCLEEKWRRFWLWHWKLWSKLFGHCCLTEVAGFGNVIRKIPWLCVLSIDMSLLVTLAKRLWQTRRTLIWVLKILLLMQRRRAIRLRLIRRQAIWLLVIIISLLPRSIVSSRRRSCVPFLWKGGTIGCVIIRSMESRIVFDSDHSLTGYFKRYHWKGA